MPDITSTHSFHFISFPLVARSYDLGSTMGGTLVLSPNAFDTPITIFFEDADYALRLARAINEVALALEEEAA